MMVRCGRCRVELEVSGPGEFVCPSCSTRNAVRGGTAPSSPLDLGSLSVPPTPPPSPGGPDPNISWVVCPSCSYRFAAGLVDAVACPNCAVRLELDETGPRIAAT